MYTKFIFVCIPSFVFVRIQILYSCFFSRFLICTYTKFVYAYAKIVYEYTKFIYAYAKFVYAYVKFVYAYVKFVRVYIYIYISI
jgi:hypothetical protein